MHVPSKLSPKSHQITHVASINTNNEPTMIHEEDDDDDDEFKIINVNKITQHQQQYNSAVRINYQHQEERDQEQQTERYYYYKQQQEQTILSEDDQQRQNIKRNVITSKNTSSSCETKDRVATQEDSSVDTTNSRNSSNADDDICLNNIRSTKHSKYSDPKNRTQEKVVQEEQVAKKEVKHQKSQNKITLMERNIKQIQHLFKR